MLSHRQSIFKRSRILRDYTSTTYI
jgi:hypothetical protein